MSRCRIPACTFPAVVAGGMCAECAEAVAHTSEQLRRQLDAFMLGGVVATCGCGWPQCPGCRRRDEVDRPRVAFGFDVWTRALRDSDGKAGAQ